MGKQCQTLFWRAPKSLQMVTEATKLKDTCSLGKKLCPTLVQFSPQLYLTLCDPMNHSMPGLPVHHRLPEFTQTHVNGNPLQYSCLENPRDAGAWWAAVYGVAQSRTRLKRLSSSLDMYLELWKRIVVPGHLCFSKHSKIILLTSGF